MRTKRKIKIDMSVEMDILMDGDRSKYQTKEYLNTIAKNYIYCLGDKDIKIENVEFV